MNTLVEKRDNVVFPEFRATLASRLLQRFSTWKQHRQAIRQLQSLPDYLLQDIGLERYQINDFVATRYTDNKVSFRLAPVEQAEIVLPHAA